MKGNVNLAYRQRTLANLEHHAPDLEQVERIQRVRRAAKHFSSVLMDECIFGSDLEVALHCVRQGCMFGVGSIVLETRDDPVPDHEGPALQVGQRVFNRRSDLFGVIQEIDGSIAKVKYEWPYDPAAPPTEVPLGSLVSDSIALEAASAGLLR